VINRTSNTEHKDTEEEEDENIGATNRAFPVHFLSPPPDGDDAFCLLLLLLLLLL
jgi:hypothetical protein